MLRVVGLLSYEDGGVQNGQRRNRSRLEIVRDVLMVVAVGVRKTRIMYQANLSYPLLEKYLHRLLRSRLVECEDGLSYSITAKGKEFLQMYTELLERHRRIREEVSGAGKDRLLLENMIFSKSFSPRQTRKERC